MLIQLTGRANYAAAGAALGLELVAHPELAAQVAEMMTAPLAETRSIDDQAAWLDDAHVLYGTGDKKYKFRMEGEKFRGDYESVWEGILKNVERQRSMGVDVRWLSPSEARMLF